MGYIIRLSLANIKLRKLRTALTIIGITIGIMSIVTMLTTGMGAKKTMMDEVEKSGSAKEILIFPQNTMRKDQILTDAIVKKIEKLDNVEAVYPVISIEGDEKIIGFMSWNSIYGVPTEYMQSLNLKEGEIPKKNGSRPELLIGNGVRESLYNVKTWQQFNESVRGNESLVGKRMDFSLSDYYMSVVDDLEKLEESDDVNHLEDTTESDTSEELDDDTKGDDNEKTPSGDSEESESDISSSENSKSKKENGENSVDSVDDSEENREPSVQKLRIVGETDNEYDYSLYTDIDSLKLYLKRQSKNGLIPGQPLDKNNRPYSTWAYSRLIIKVDKTENVEHVSKVIKDMGYQVHNNLEAFESVNRTVDMVQFILGAIGLIAGIVAVIGIINTMMTAVYDRVREIGLLKMLGSDSDDISFMFLFESALMGFVGGVFGVILSLIVNIYINNKLVVFMKMPEETWIMNTPAWLILLAVAASVFVSVLAGAFPARWASRIKPLEAIAG
ncbi:MAG: ABC transporter permease [Eubacterium sp.]|nr:ABC transporter permease [Eubacterium sp.]